jgi:hypothetical protein
MQTALCGFWQSGLDRRAARTVALGAGSVIFVHLVQAVFCSSGVLVFVGDAERAIAADNITARRRLSPLS